MDGLFKTALQWAENLKKQYDSCHIAAYSAEAAFFVLVSAVPLIMLAVVLLGALAPLDVIGFRQTLAQVFNENATGYIADILADIVSHSTIPLASVTMMFLIWAATKGVRSIGEGLDAIYGSREEYNTVQLAVRSIIYTFAMIAICALSFGVLVMGAPLESLIKELLGQNGAFLLVLLNLRNVIFFITLTVLFATAYRVLAKSSLCFCNQLPGAAVAAAGWLIYSFGYSVYIKYFSSYSTLYGGFGAVMLFMLWMYMCMNILLCGALLNKIIYFKNCD